MLPSVCSIVKFEMLPKTGNTLVLKFGLFVSDLVNIDVGATVVKI